MSPELLAAQFQQYEAELDRIDSEDTFKSGMHGDLMASRRARDHLNLETMDHTTLYSLGHGHMHEKQFFELLQLHSIRVLYDLRGTDYRQELHGAGSFSLKFLKATCKARGIFYKQMPIGREGAYGTLAHLGSDEAKHTLIELLWQGKRRPTAFLGRDPEWRQDPRLAIAEVLAGYGHEVQHITDVGSLERHEAGIKMPDFLTNEEERLRNLEKQRQAGELKRPDKASDSRSTEAVAKALSTERESLDVGKELFECENQTQLKFAQQRLARMQRVADEKGALVKGRQLTHVPKYVKAEAKAQAAWISERKKMKESAKGNPTGKVESGTPETGASSSAASTEAPIPSAGVLLVECAVCKKQLPWVELSAGDGVCADCSAAGEEQDAEEECGDLMVDCSRCHQASSWSLLRLGDGVCPTCFEEQDGREERRGANEKCATNSAGESEDFSSQQADGTKVDDAATSQSASASTGGWRSRRRLQQDAKGALSA